MRNGFDQLAAVSPAFALMRECAQKKRFSLLYLIAGAVLTVISRPHWTAIVLSICVGLLCGILQLHAASHLKLSRFRITYWVFAALIVFLGLAYKSHLQLHGTLSLLGFAFLFIGTQRSFVGYLHHRAFSGVSMSMERKD